MKSRYLYFVVIFVLSGCASHPKEIDATYVSSIQYSDHNCEQIAMEFRRVTRRINTLYYSLEEEADADDTQMAVGMILLWPTLFWLEGGDGPEAAEYAQLKGEFNALEEAAIMKKCSSGTVPSNPEERIREAEKQKELEKQKEELTDADET